MAVESFMLMRASGLLKKSDLGRDAIEIEGYSFDSQIMGPSRSARRQDGPKEVHINLASSNPQFANLCAAGTVIETICVLTYYRNPTPYMLVTISDAIIASYRFWSAQNRSGGAMAISISATKVTVDTFA